MVVHPGLFCPKYGRISVLHPGTLIGLVCSIALLIIPGVPGAATIPHTVHEASDEKASRDISVDDLEIDETNDEPNNETKEKEDRVRFGVGIEFNYDFMEYSDIEDRESGRWEDFYIGTLEGVLEADITPWLAGQIVLTIEDIRKKEEEVNLQFDDAWVSLQAPQTPLYAVFGIRTQPFGFFESRLISSTIGEDLYEIDDVGLTVGVDHHPSGLDSSLTVYKQGSLHENLADLDLIDGELVGHRESTEYSSFIANITWQSASEAIRAGLFYQSEPGETDRLQSIGAASTIEWEWLILDAEFITAIDRDPLPDGEELDDMTWYVGLAFVPADLVDLAVRYEYFDSGRGTLENPIVEWIIRGGVNFHYREWATLSVELADTHYDIPADSEAVRENRELLFQLALGF